MVFLAELALVIMVTAANALPGSKAPAALPMAAVQNIAVFGRDERRPLPQKFADLKSKIGILYDKRLKSVCSAFCVSTDVVATAGHCLFQTTGNTAPNLADFSFRIGPSGKALQSRIAGTVGAGQARNVVAGSTSLRVKPPIDATRDWALVRLHAPVCTSGGLPVRAAEPAELLELTAKKKLHHSAFHNDLPKFDLALSTTCSVRQSFENASSAIIARDFRNAENLILHTCDTGGASSGSPLLVDGANGLEVVGINIGTYLQSKVTMLNGQIVERHGSETIANTAVSSRAFLGQLNAFLRPKPRDPVSEITTSAIPTKRRQVLTARP